MMALLRTFALAAAVSVLAMAPAMASRPDWTPPVGCGVPPLSTVDDAQRLFGQLEKYLGDRSAHDYLPTLSTAQLGDLSALGGTARAAAGNCGNMKLAREITRRELAIKAINDDALRQNSARRQAEEEQRRQEEARQQERDRIAEAARRLEQQRQAEAAQKKAEEERRARGPTASDLAPLYTIYALARGCHEAGLMSMGDAEVIKAKARKIIAESGAPQELRDKMWNTLQAGWDQIPNPSPAECANLRQFLSYSFPDLFQSGAAKPSPF